MATTLRDVEIRSALRTKLQHIHADEPDTAIIEELSLCQGNARVDIAVVNGLISGYEIKSDRDKLVRLPHQLSVYQRCLDAMTVVAGRRHIAACYETLPPCWGIWEASSTPDGVSIQSRREPMPNGGVEPQDVVQLLWRGEAYEALQERGISPPRRGARRDLWAALLSGVPSRELLEIVRDRIRARGDWRSGPTPFRGGGLSRCVAGSQRSQMNRQWLLSRRSRCRPH